MKEKRNLTTSIEGYKNPFVPQGFTHVKGTWNDGFTISDSNGNAFAWVPVGWLLNNGTLNGTSFDLKFGRRNWYNYDFSEKGWHENVPKHIVESINEWGGFYFSCCTASLEKNAVVFKKGYNPLVEMSYDQALDYESSFKTSTDEIEHQLAYGAAYDSIIQWIIQKGTKKAKDLLDDSSEFGNYANNEKYHRKNKAVELLPTGSNEDWCIHNIYDLAGNTEEFTQEKYGDNNRVVLRSGNYRVVGRYWPIADRYFRQPHSRKVNLGSFRSMLVHA